MADTLYPSHNFPFFDAHHWEDWVELCCIASLDGEADVASMTDRLREERDVPKNNKSLEEEEFVEEFHEVSGSDEPDELLAEAHWADGPDKKMLRVKGWFLSLASRAQLLADHYPFTLSPDNAKLTLRPKLSDTNRLYIALLMMSNLHYFNKAQADLTSSFEILGQNVFSWMLPNNAIIHRFGKGKGNKGRYKGHIWDKLKLLADDLSCEIKCRKEQFAPNDNGEGGLDLVGWVPWQDSAPGRLLLFGQCACTPKWVSKQNEASAATWNSKFEFVTAPLTVILIPFFLRTNGGGWHRQTDFAGHLIIDRLRFLRVLEANVAKLLELPAFEHVNACLAAKEGAF